jgi:general secretion pathway protein C
MQVGLTIITYFVIALFTLGNNDKYANVEKSSGEALGVIIMGSIAHADPAQTVVLIKEIAQGSVKAVKRGFKVLKKYKVVEATSKFLVLEKEGGERHLVYQSKFAGEFIAKPSAPAAQRDLDFYAEDGFERRGGSIKLSGSFRDKVINNDLSKIMMQASAIPNYVNGQIKGFKLLQIDEGSIYDNAGFKDEDVITSINGTPLDNISATIKLLNSLKNETHIEVEYERGGESKTTTIDVQ